MKCNHCNNEANIEIQFMGDDLEFKKINLCSECIESYFLNNLFSQKEMKLVQDNLKDLIPKILGSFNLEEEKEENIESCDCCDTVFSNIEKKGRFGCDFCYEKFYDQIKNNLQKTQGATKHIGDIPLNQIDRKNKIDEIEKKKEELDELVLLERYEEAILIRDELKEMEANLKGE